MELDTLVEDLVISYPAGMPVVVVVQDYRERTDLVEAITGAASLFGVEVTALRSLDEAMDRLPQLDAGRDQAALILVDPGSATVWGQWLEASRETLPTRVRFLLVLIMERDFPVLARQAPGFVSWAKALGVERLVDSARIPAAEFDQELQRMQEATGLSPAEYVEAWERGDLPDTHRNAAWLNLAYTAADRSVG